MNLLFSFTVLLFARLAAAAPAGETVADDTVVITKEFFPKSLVKYKGQHDIVNIIVPLNSFNFDDDDSSSSEELDADVTFFFVEADVDADGKRVDKGLYVFKNNSTKKLLDNGRDAAASGDNSTKVYFGAQDGLYVYKPETNEAVKYGTITDSIIGIAITKGSEDLYILTEDHEVYKVTNEGNEKTKVDQVVNAKQIVVDYSNNLYFYGEDKKPHVLTADGVKNIEGLPADPNEVNLIKPPFIIDDGVPFIVDNKAYIIFSNGSCTFSDFEFSDNAKPTAYGMEATLIQYYALNKKIYEYNILAMVLGEIMDELKSYLENKTDDIKTLASKRNRKP